MLLLLGALPSRGRAEASDYAADNGAWNGLSQLLALSRELALDVRTPARVELGELREGDGLLVVFPARPPPQRELAAFVTAGGRLAIADDFGAAGGLFASFDITRDAPPRSALAHALRGNPNLLLALAQGSHPLTEGVRALVTNHPRSLRHTSLQPLFGWGDAPGALVLAGAVGAGRLVAIGDPSVIINNMLDLRGNRAFTRNLVRFLAPSSRLWIAGPDTTWAGAFGARGAGPVAGVRELLQRLSRAQLPPSALRFATWVVACALLVAAATSLPRRSVYLRAVALQSAETYGGFAGRVRLFMRKRSNLVLPALNYKRHLERRLVLALQLAHDAKLRDVRAALQKARLPSRDIARLESLLVDLQALAVAQEDGSGAARVGARKFHDMVRTGERILAALGERRALDFQA